MNVRHAAALALARLVFDGAPGTGGKLDIKVRLSLKGLLRRAGSGPRSGRERPIQIREMRCDEHLDAS